MTRRGWCGFGPVCLALVTLILAVPAAHASSTACRQIERQLAGGGAAAPRDARRYERAIRTQTLELQKIRAQLAHAGCTGFFGSLRGQCGSLQATAQRMEANLGKLEQTHAGLQGRPAGKERARLLAAYERGGCDARPARTRTSALAAPKARPAAPTDTLFGEETPEASRPSAAGMRAGDGRPRRAMCVRTCDGYFFPIAFTATTANFTADQQRCEAACPETEVELYYDSRRDGDGSGMVSGRTGAAYDALPTAFLYKRPGYQRAVTCGCNMPKGYSVVAGQAASVDPLEAPAAPPLPPRSEGSIVSPAAPAPATAHAATAPEPSPEKTSSVDAEPAADRAVRVVGPKFLPDPSEMIDLRAPAHRR